jgi:hypothetical protein
MLFLNSVYPSRNMEKSLITVMIRGICTYFQRIQFSFSVCCNLIHLFLVVAINLLIVLHTTIVGGDYCLFFGGLGNYLGFISPLRAGQSHWHTTVLPVTSCCCSYAQCFLFCCNYLCAILLRQLKTSITWTSIWLAKYRSLVIGIMSTCNTLHRGVDSPSDSATRCILLTVADS